MRTPELSISVGDLLGVPRVTLRGYMDGWHDQAVIGVLAGLSEQSVTSLVMDLTALRFTGVDGATGLIRILRSISPEQAVHIVAAGTPDKVLKRAKLGPSVRLYTSADEIADYLAPEDDFFTSRWLPPTADDAEQPLAA